MRYCTQAKRRRLEALEMAEQRRQRRLAAGPFHMLRKNALQVIIVQIAH